MKLSIATKNLNTIQHSKHDTPVVYIQQHCAVLTHAVSPGGVQPHGDHITIYKRYTVSHTGLDKRR